MWRFRHVATRYINPITRRVARRLPSFGVLTHRGRKTGRSFHTPVNVFRRGDEYYFFLTYGVGRAMGEKRPCRQVVLARNTRASRHARRPRVDHRSRTATRAACGPLDRRPHRWCHAVPADACCPRRPDAAPPLTKHGGVVRCRLLAPSQVARKLARPSCAAARRTACFRDLLQGRITARRKARPLPVSRLHLTSTDNRRSVGANPSGDGIESASGSHRNFLQRARDDLHG
jgi:hypothetical protein